MKTLTINGAEYVGARALEKHFNLTRKRCWQLLKRSELPHEEFCTSWLYPAAAAVEFITLHLNQK